MPDGSKGKRQHFHTGFDEETGAWYALDNAALLMPAIAGQAATYLFRFSFELRERIKLPELQAALDRVSARFPYFTVELRHGLFWHYMEKRQTGPRVEADDIYPCQSFDIFRRGRCLYRVRAHDRTITCEFFHVITDGTGGIRFLKNLVAEYFRRLGVEPDARDPELYDLDAKPSPGEYEDAYKKSCPDAYLKPEAEGKAYHYRSPLLPKGVYRVTSGIVPLKPALAKAKELGVTVTELLAAAYIDALQETWFADPRARRGTGKIRLEVPVNMRKFFETESNRNFTLLVRIDQDAREGKRSFEETLNRVHHQMRFKLDKKSLLRQIFRNVAGERIMAVRVLPLVLKTLFMKYLFWMYGDNRISGILSNVGKIEFPPALDRHIADVNLVMAPNPAIKTICGVISFRDTLRITFGGLSRGRDIERLFLSRLASLGLNVRVECNMEAHE